MCDNGPPRRFFTFVTEQPTPVGVTHTFPGLSAAAVDAARERHTLVAERTLPAVMAPEGTESDGEEW